MHPKVKQLAYANKLMLSKGVPHAARYLNRKGWSIEGARWVLLHL